MLLDSKSKMATNRTVSGQVRLNQHRPGTMGRRRIPNNQLFSSDFKDSRQNLKHMLGEDNVAVKNGRQWLLLYEERLSDSFPN